jgi:hypothetical protein
MPVKLPEECGYAIVYARLLVQNLRILAHMLRDS